MRSIDLNHRDRILGERRTALQGLLIYKCRLCGGAEFLDVADIHGAMLLVRVAHEQDTTDILIPHRCDNGDYGVADLQGGRAIQEPNG